MFVIELTASAESTAIVWPSSSCVVENSTYVYAWCVLFAVGTNLRTEPVSTARVDGPIPTIWLNGLGGNVAPLTDNEKISVAAVAATCPEVNAAVRKYKYP